MATGDRGRTPSEFDEVYSLVYEVLAAEVDAQVIRRDDPDVRTFFLQHGSIPAYVTVMKLRSGNVVARMECLLLSDVEPTPELFSFVATHADLYYEGHLHLLPRKPDAPRYSIHLSNDLFATQVTPAGVREFIHSLAFKADSIDDEIRHRFGGSLR